MSGKRTLREQLEYIKPLEETTLYVKNIVAKFGKVTGSVAFKVDSADSDLDVILPPNCGINMGEVIDSHNGIYLHRNDEEGITHHYREKDFESCYILGGGSICNLLFMKSFPAYKAWCYATDKILSACENDPVFKKRLRGKDFRVAVFETLKAEFHGKQHE